MLLPAGYYNAKCIEFQWCLSSKGTKSIACRFELQTDSDVSLENNHLTWFGYFSEKAWARTCEALNHMGWDGLDLTELGKLDQNVSLSIIEDEYEGKIRNKIQWVNSVGRKGISVQSPMSETDVRQFAAQMKGRLGTLNLQPPTDQVSKEQPLDEIPF